MNTYSTTTVQFQGIDSLRRKHLRRKRIVTLELMFSLILCAVVIGLVYGIPFHAQVDVGVSAAAISNPIDTSPANDASRLARTVQWGSARLPITSQSIGDTRLNSGTDLLYSSSRDSSTTKEERPTTRSHLPRNSEQAIVPAVHAVAQLPTWISVDRSIPQLAVLSMIVVAIGLIAVGIQSAVRDKRRAC